MFFFFFNDTATTEIYTLSLHDALPISVDHMGEGTSVNARAEGNAAGNGMGRFRYGIVQSGQTMGIARSEEHTSELQSRQYLVCRLLLEKKKKQKKQQHTVKAIVAMRTT